MKWKKFTIQTTTAAEDFISEKLSEIGIEGILCCRSEEHTSELQSH